MEKFSDDLVINVVQQGIKRGIDVAIENHCYGSSVILIYSAIDTMAFLGMPAAQKDVARADFVAWADRYMRFPCKEQITGIELYAARCAMLHNYGTRSRLSRKGQARQVGYADHAIPEVRFDPQISDELVMVSIQALRTSLFQGIDRYLVDLFVDSARAPVAEERLRWLVHVFDVRENSDSSLS